MRGVTFILALFVLSQVSQAAVLLRFINTVPTRTPVASRNAAEILAYGAGYVREASDVVVNARVDRVGLLYTVTEGSTQSATTVWTELRGELELATDNASPYSWIFGMPPLRAYHGATTASGEASAVDRVANLLIADNHNIDPSCDDAYVQSQLKADGVGLYLSFAPGRYNIGAYGVRGGATATAIVEAHGNVGQRFTSADSVMTFQDGQVYTLIAMGNGNFGANNGAGSFGDSATVKLVLLQESTAPTTFGMASIRFFHAIQAASADNVDIQDTTTRNTVVNGLGFGSASSYMDVVPKTRRDYAIVRSSNTQVPLAPTDALAFGSSMDVRAGLRATVICANTDVQNPAVFCRMIPSRVVAYVRLINDNAANFNYALGSVAAQRMSDITLSLWASYHMPYPSQVQEQAQNIGVRCPRIDGAAISNRGLYPVVSDVPVNSVSDYGEVHVPLFIMDYAVRSIIREVDCRATPAGSAYIVAGTNDDPQNPASTVAPAWFELSPIMKRVNFIVKTSGYATISGRADVNAVPTKWNTVPSGRATLLNSLLLNEYMEPGQYYTLASTPVTEATANLAFLQLPRHTAFRWRLDASVADVSSGIASTTGTVRFITLPGQTFTAQTLSVSGRSATFGGFTNTFINAQSTNAGKVAWVVPAASESIALAAGTYTWSSPASATPCTQSIPSGSFTIQNGKALDIFVLGSYSCTQQSTSLTLVQKVPARAAQASASCAPSAPQALTRSAAVSVAPSSLLVFFGAIIAALAAAML